MIGLYMAVLIVAFVLIKADYTRGLRASEARNAAIFLGEERVLDSLRTGNGIFSSLFNESGLIKWSYELANAHRNSKAPLFNHEKASDSMLAKTDAFWESCRLAVQRFVFMFYWLPVLIPFIIAAMVDGAMTREIRNPNRLRLCTNEQQKVTMRSLVKLTLRARPDRIVLGEIRGPEAFDLMQAMNTGHDGCMASIHANSAKAALSRLETLVLTANTGWPIEANLVVGGSRSGLGCGYSQRLQESRRAELPTIFQ